MALTKLFKLEKLKIKAYSKVRRLEGDVVGTFEAMFNPESFKQKYEIQYSCGQGVGSTDQSATYTRSRPTGLDLKLVLDGTGVHEMGIAQLGSPQSVTDRVKKFLDLTFRMNGDIHEPNYLLVEWGTLSFSCRLGSVEVSYTSFDRDGTPLRAELVITLESDTEVNKRLQEENKTSPDLTHGRVVRDGDTLPLLTKEIYGTSEHYLTVAAFNGLDNFRKLTPGQEILFPPLEAGAGGKAQTRR